MLYAAHARSIIAARPVRRDAGGRAETHTASQSLAQVVAEHRHVPLPDQCADIAIAGWTHRLHVAIRARLAKRTAIRSSRDAACAAARRRDDHHRDAGHRLRRTESAAERLARTIICSNTISAFDSSGFAPIINSLRWTKRVKGLAFSSVNGLPREIHDQQWAVVPECTGIWWKIV